MYLLFLFLTFFTVSISAKNTYIVTVPKYIRPGSDADVCVNILKRRGPVTITAELMDKNETNTLDTATGIVRPMTQTVVKLKVPSDIKTIYDYRIRVSGTGNISFRKTVRNVEVREKATSLFIQTDRPIYKPGDLVRFRTFGTFPNLKYVTEPMDIVIQDPKNNIVQQYLGVTPPYGVFGGEFQLSTVTSHGRWRIRAKQLRETVYQSFEVKRYVLPKFEVDIILPAIQLRTDEYFRFGVTAKYTFGKPVIGKVNVTLGYNWAKDRQISKIFRIDGTANIRILMKEVLSISTDSIPIFVEVTESITGNTANDTISARIYDYLEKLTFSYNQATVFKPGLDYTYILKVSKIDDTPLPYPAGRVNITVYYYVYKKVTVKPNLLDEHQEERKYDPRCPATPPTEQKLLFTKLIEVPKDGIIVDNVRFPRDAVRGRIDAKFNKRETARSLARAGSASDNYIQVRFADPVKAQLDKPLSLLIKGTEEVKICYYKIFSKNSLVQKGEISQCLDGRLSNTINTIVTTDMAPTAVLLLYYIRMDGEVVADAIVFSLDELFQKKVAITYDKKQVTPAENVELRIQADPNSLVNVLAVDKSVLLMRTGNDITDQNVLSELQRYSTIYDGSFREWDSWWPRPVYGRDAFGVFDTTMFLWRHHMDSTSHNLYDLPAFVWMWMILMIAALLLLANSCNKYSGVYVLTDANLYQYVDLQPIAPSVGRFRARMRSAGAEGPPGDAGSPGPASGGESFALPTRTRTNFPETWIWANITTSPRGSATIQATAPDTITEWITSAFAMNPVTGLGVADTLANLTTFQSFFLRLELPYSVIRGEILVLQATVFNYMNTRLEISLKKSYNKTLIDFGIGKGMNGKRQQSNERQYAYMSGNPGLRQVLVKLNAIDHLVFSDNNGNPIDPSDGGLTKRIFVDANGIGAVYFPILTKKVGTVKLQVSARSQQIADAVERELLIEAEGIKESYNLPVLVDLRNQNSFVTALNIEFPPNVIPDSQFIKISVIGDIMAQTLTGLENLLQMSYGCGEQNMVVFSPNVYVSNYLRATNRITDEISEKIERLLRLGYQRQLSYMRDDGSFSAFGNNDKKGSTWLTAFVVKSFSQAARLTFIDPNVMKSAISYLLNRQDEGSGEFKEEGVVLHKAMQGGSASSKKTLTAFVLVALLEAHQNKQVPSELQERVTDAVAKAKTYISDGGAASIDNLYELILICYALTLANDPGADELLTVIEQKSSTDGITKFWALSSTEADILSSWKTWTPPRTKSRAIDVEMTSYVLLIYGLKKDTMNGVQVLLWLGEQRNPNGGFISTQDTVVALQALAGIAAELYSSNFGINVDVMASQWTKTFNVYNNNSLVLQSADVTDPATVSQVIVNARGSGICLVQAAVYYNVPEELREPAFDLTVNVLQDSIRGFRLRVCFRWLRSGESTMGYLEIHLPTGMDADISSLDTTEASGLFKKIERVFRKVDLYFDKVTSRIMCIEIEINRVDLVARHQPVPVRVSEYYEQSNEVIKLYSSPVLRNATVFEVCAGGICEEVKK